MSTVFIQKDGEFEISFIWSEDIDTLKNLLSVYYEDVISYGVVVLGYYTKDFEAIYSTCNVVFDEVLAIENDEVDGDYFVNYCKETLNGQ